MATTVSIYTKYNIKYICNRHGKNANNARYRRAKSKVRLNKQNRDDHFEQTKTGQVINANPNDLSAEIVSERAGTSDFSSAAAIEQMSAGSATSNDEELPGAIAKYIQFDGKIDTIF